MPGLDISFRNDLCKVLFVLVVIKSSSMMNLKLVQKFCANQRSNRILSPELILSGLAHNLMN
jgi:hypothetical protein